MDARHESDRETRGFKIGLTLIIVSVLVGLFLLSAETRADSATLNYLAPTRCTDGSLLSQCPVTGYYATQQFGTDWRKVKSVSASTLQITVEEFTSGQYFWKVHATSDNGDSGPSGIFTKTFVDATVIVPKPPTPIRKTIGTNAYRVATNYSTFKFVRGSLSGTVALDVPCDFRTTGDDYHYVSKTAVKAIPGVVKQDYNVAKCSIL